VNVAISGTVEPASARRTTAEPRRSWNVRSSLNVGKTFSVIHCGESVVGGDKWFSRNVEQSGVLYCFGEGGEGFRNRLAAYRSRYDADHKGMIVRDGIPNLGLNLAKAIKALEKAIDESNAMYGAHSMKPVRVVFLDTFAKAIAGAQENDTSAVQPDPQRCAGTRAQEGRVHHSHSPQRQGHHAGRSRFERAGSRSGLQP
jgi:hypothetical protein